LLAAICFLAITPFLWLGIPSGHDFEFHMFSWMEVVSQWKQGIVYPRWAALAHWSYGEARFLFYPPASWTLGAAMGAVMPWPMVPGAYIWIVLCLAGLSMFQLARKWLPAPDALFAAAVYAVNPYHLVIIYWRSAYAELLASALLPVLVLCAVRLEERGIRPVMWMGLTLAAAWLTNAPAAVMIHYSLALFVAVNALLERSWRPLGKATMAILLGAGLASFYLIPAAYEEKWVNIAEVLAPGVRPQDNFLFTVIADPDHNRFNLLVSTVAVAEIAALAAALWFSRAWQGRQRKLWVLLSTWAGVAALLMFSVTNLCWQHLPKLRFVQLPWRWLLCLNAALALLLAMAIPRWSLQALTTVALLAVVIVAGHRIQPPWWDTASDVREMATAMAAGTGNEGTDEYVPAGADPYELNKDQPRVIGDSGKPVRAEITNWGAMEKHLLVHRIAPENLTLRLFNYPAWEVTVNGERVETQTTDVTGLIMFPIPAGKSDVRVRFGRTRDRTIGDVLSLISLAVFCAIWVTARTRFSAGVHA
jgi:hypothetical protein